MKQSKRSTVEYVTGTLQYFSTLVFLSGRGQGNSLFAANSITSNNNFVSVLRRPARNKKRVPVEKQRRTKRKQGSRNHLTKINETWFSPGEIVFRETLAPILAP